MPEAVIVDTIRTPIGRAFKGSSARCAQTRWAPTSSTGCWSAIPEVDPAGIEDLYCGYGAGARRARGPTEGQRAVLDRAAALVDPGGRIAYVTCSILAPETASKSSTSSPATPNSRWCRRCDRAVLGKDRGFRRGGAEVGRGMADDTAAHRHRWIFCVGADAADGLNWCWRR